MFFQVKARLDQAAMMEFVQKLRSDALDHSAIRSEAYCLKSDPAVGFSIWEAADRAAFDKAFAPWDPYYTEVEITEMITAQQSMGELIKRLP